MDIYTTNENNRVYAYAISYNGQTALPISQKDYQDWYWAKIKLNIPMMNQLGTARRCGTIVHEMLHGYGFKDVYDNRNNIMYGYMDTTNVSYVTQEVNNKLNEKYK